MPQRTMDILRELAGLYDQRRRFGSPKSANEPAWFSARELAEYRNNRK